MRGQISFDIIFAIIIAFIAVSSIVIVNGEITKMQTQASVRQQLDGIGTGLASVISASEILNDASSAAILIPVPKLMVVGERRTQACDITIAGGQITLEYDIIDIETGLAVDPLTGRSTVVTVQKDFKVPAGMTVPASVKCGETLAITKS